MHPSESKKIFQSKEWPRKPLSFINKSLAKILPKDSTTKRLSARVCLKNWLLIYISSINDSILQYHHNAHWRNQGLPDHLQFQHKLGVCNQEYLF